MKNIIIGIVAFLFPIVVTASQPTTITTTQKNITKYCQSEFADACYIITESGQAFILHSPSSIKNRHIREHEKCHHTWFMRMTQEQREEYAEIYTKIPPITAYSRVSVEESFAENCAFFRQTRQHRQRLHKLTFTFLKNNIK